MNDAKDIFQKIAERDAAVNARKVTKARKLYHARIDCFPGDSRRGSHLHSRKVAQRAVRLLKTWGLDAYLAAS